MCMCTHVHTETHECIHIYTMHTIEEARRKTQREDHGRDMSIYKPRRKALRGIQPYYLMSSF